MLKVPQAPMHTLVITATANTYIGFIETTCLRFDDLLTFFGPSRTNGCGNGMPPFNAKKGPSCEYCAFTPSDRNAISVRQVRQYPHREAPMLGAKRVTPQTSVLICVLSRDNSVGLSILSTLTKSATPPCDFVSGRPLLYLLRRQNAGSTMRRPLEACHLLVA